MAMTYTNLEGRQQVLDALVRATDEIGYALASVGAAYEQLDETTGDRLEEELFGPVQAAYARAQRTHAGFASRHGLATHSFEQQTAGAPSRGARGFIDDAVAGISEAGTGLAALQDSEMALEVGDAELRAAVSDLRRLIDPLPHRARELERTLGR
jgi:hypothetical protein